MARPEVAGKAPLVGPQQRTVEKMAFTIPEFCARHSISRAFYYELKKQGKTPREVRDLGRIPIITIEAETEWRAARNAAAEVAALPRAS